MKGKLARLVLVLGIILILATGVAYAFGEPPAGLTGEITLIAKDANTVTLHAEQTGGDPVTLILEHYCYQGDAYAGFERVRFTGSTDATFNIGPRKWQGKNYEPTDCWAYLTYYFSSSRAVVLDGEITLP